jgi:hypothetical protein
MAEDTNSAPPALPSFVVTIACAGANTDVVCKAADDKTAGAKVLTQFQETMPEATLAKVTAKS